MDFADIINSFKTDYDNLKYFGINMQEDGRMSILFMVYSFTVQVVVMGLLNVMLIINWILNSTNITGFASTGYIITSCIFAHVKLSFIYRNKDHFAKLMKQLKLQSFRFQNPEELVTGCEEYQFFHKAKIMLFGLTLIAVLSSITTPFIMKRYDELPFPAWYPMDVSKPPAFYIAFLHQSVALAFAYFYVDMLLCGMLTFIGIQCNVLCQRVEKLGKTEPGREKHQVLLHCVVHHNDIIGFLKTTDKVFGNIYLWQLFASTMTLCMGLFLVSLTDSKTFEFFYLVVYLIAIATLLLVPCWFASEMTRKSENIPIAAYNCYWMNANDSFKKELVFFIQRSQRPLKLYAADFFEISLETFMKIIRSSLSYFAVLTNLNT